MIKKLLGLFFEDTSKEFTSYQLISKVSQWGKTRDLPYDYELPNSILFDSSFTKRISEIQKGTTSDDHERAFNVFSVDSELIVTEEIKGTTSSVTSKSVVSARYIKSSQEGYFKKQIHVDSKLYSEKDIYYKRIPKKIEIIYLFNVHTHPCVNGSYSFFSLTDINSLINSSGAITGLITDRLWLLVKTVKSPKVLNNYTEAEITKDSLTDRIKLGVYEGSIGKKLYRYLPSSPKNK